MFSNRVFEREAEKNGGVAPPEARLYMGEIGGVLTPLGMLFSSRATSSNSSYRALSPGLHHLPIRSLARPNHRLDLFRCRCLLCFHLRLHVSGDRCVSSASRPLNASHLPFLFQRIGPLLQVLWLPIVP